MKLTMYPVMTSRTGNVKSDSDRVHKYEVRGMPDEEGWITESDGKWWVTRGKDGKHWPGTFDTPEEALAVLQKEFDP